MNEEEWLRNLFPGYSEPRRARFNADGRRNRNGYPTWGFDYGRDAPDPDEGKIIDIFEPAEGRFMILDKQIQELGDGYFLGIKEKMQQKHGYHFHVEDVNGGIMITWRPQYARTA